MTDDFERRFTISMIGICACSCLVGMILGFLLAADCNVVSEAWWVKPLCDKQSVAYLHVTR